MPPRTKDHRFPRRLYSNLFLADWEYHDSSFEECEFQRCRLDRITLAECTFDRCTFVDCEFDHCSIKSTAFRDCAFRDTRFSTCELGRSSFSSCHFLGGHFRQECAAPMGEGPSLEGSTFEGTSFFDCRFTPKHLEQAKFTRANFNKSDALFANRVAFKGRQLQACTFNQCNIRLCVFDGCDLSRSQFLNIDSEDVQLNGAILEGSLFQECTMANASLARAQLQHAELRECKLLSVNLESATLDHARIYAQFDISGARIHGASFDHVHVDDPDRFIFDEPHPLGRLRGASLWRRVSAPRPRSASAKQCNHLSFRNFCNAEGARDHLFAHAHHLPLTLRAGRLAMLAMMPLRAVRFTDHAFFLAQNLVLSCLLAILGFAAAQTFTTDRNFLASAQSIALALLDFNGENVASMARGFIVGGLLAGFMSELFKGTRHD